MLAERTLLNKTRVFVNDESVRVESVTSVISAFLTQWSKSRVVFTIFVVANCTGVEVKRSDSGIRTFLIARVPCFLENARVPLVVTVNIPHTILAATSCLVVEEIASTEMRFLHQVFRYILE